jgi:hypothetical protein
MKIKLTKSITDEVEITFPHYRKSDHAYMKIISEEEAVEIKFYTTTSPSLFVWRYHQTIEKNASELHEESNEQEFQDALQKYKEDITIERDRLLEMADAYVKEVAV